MAIGLCVNACVFLSILQSVLGYLDTSALDSLFHHNMDDFRPFLHTLQSDITNGTVDMISGQDLFNLLRHHQKPVKLACLLLFQYKHTKHKIDMVTTVYSHSSCSHVMLPRIVAYQVFFEFLTERVEQGRKSFYFFVELSGGAVMPRIAFKMLKYPVLTASRSPQRPFSFLFPESYIIYAFMRSNETLYKRGLLLEPSLESTYKGWGAGVARIFQMQYKYVPWNEKLPKLGYRGSCMRTYDPLFDETNQTFMMPRGDVCRVVHELNSSSYDVKMSVAPKCPSEVCAHCTSCAADSAWTRIDDQAGWKYHLNIDGLAATADALFWKLGSGGTVFQWVDRESYPDFTYVQWFSHLLIPYKNIIPVTATTLVKAVEWCIANDLECKGIGDNARRLAQEVLNFDGVIRYALNFLRHMMHEP